MTDHEYIPGAAVEESDGDIHDDWEAEKDEVEGDESTSKSPRSSRKSDSRSSHKCLVVAKWMHSVSSDYKEYREKVKEVWSELYEGQGVLQGEEWTVRPQHWRILSSR